MDRNTPSIMKTLFKSQVKVPLNYSQGSFLNLLHIYIFSFVCRCPDQWTISEGDRMYALYRCDFTGIK